MIRIAKEDPAVDTVVGFTGAGSGGGGGSTNTATLFAALKPLSQRDVSVDDVIARLRPKLGHVPGGRLYFQAAQDFRAGARSSAAQYQYTLSAEKVGDLYEWAQKLTDALVARGSSRT